MKEIKNKIKDSIFGEFNHELIGDKVKLQNKVNKLQRMIDMINYFQPIEEKENFVLPDLWCIKRNDNNTELITNYFNKLHNFNYYELKYNTFNPYLYHSKISGKGSSSNSVPKYYTEITFEQFKKYVLNEK